MEFKPGDRVVVNTARGAVWATVFETNTNVFENFTRLIVVNYDGDTQRNRIYVSPDHIIAMEVKASRFVDEIPDRTIQKVDVTQDMIDNDDIPY